ncbi:sodium-dependent phosphate transport protein 2B-like [Styela clava]|uniref:sodium-dependent phosphate transport protein 2B-like n=1 Tax=Styela clava TaxID=7725 RepID=UPI00193A24D0|nr:sodium-dependent phosphate transport protein 2B-like [Styela clava]
MATNKMIEAEELNAQNSNIDMTNEELRKKLEEDAWAIVIDDCDDDDVEKFSDMSGKHKILHIMKIIGKIFGVLATLYIFVCSLSLMSSAFQILGGKTGGQLFNNEYLSNPITGLIIGILVTVLVQSSSTSTSIIITMVGAGILNVHEAIPIIMGSNIGTSVTNTIVSLTQSMDRDQFRKSFGGATVHDMFNFLSVIILLPLEVLTGYLEKTTEAIVSSSNLNSAGGEGPPDMLDVITDPLTEHVIQVNKTIIGLIALEVPLEADASMIKVWCEQHDATINVTYSGNSTQCNFTATDCNVEETVLVGVEKCNVHDFIFANTGMTDPAVGGIILILSLFVLCACLVMMVKLLSSMLKGSVARVIKKVLNTNFPYPFGWISGYLAILSGAILTFVVQSSTVFTSTMTPLVGLGVISLKRMYPLTLGANIGTTATGILAAFATESDAGMIYALQLSLCHFFFNISGILIWYPIPIMRRVPLRAARFMGNTTAEYKWFAVLYLIFAFFLIPGVILGLSFAGIWIMGGFLILVAVIVICVIILNVLQSRKPEWLPESMQTWEFLPAPLRSLQPYDKVFSKFLLCCKCCNEEEAEEQDPPSYDSSMENISVIDVDYEKSIINSSGATPILSEKQGFSDHLYILENLGNENPAYNSDDTTTQL